MEEYQGIYIFMFGESISQEFRLKNIDETISYLYIHVWRKYKSRNETKRYR